MAIFLRYRTFTAALLLLLYAWVAMPVQWWHHHASKADFQLLKISKSKLHAKHTSIFAKAPAGKGNAFADDCFVCSHQYAAHDGIAFSVTIASPVIHIAFQTARRTCWQSISTDLLSDRGPPAFI